MNQKNTKRAGAIPRLAMINSFAGYGRCSTTIALPVISTMQVQVCPVPTSILSNHLGYPSCYFDDYTIRMSEYLRAWEQLSFSFDGLYCGFLGNIEQITIVKEFLNSPIMQKCHLSTPQKTACVDSVSSDVAITARGASDVISAGRISAGSCQERPIFLLDPVMGDHGRAYSRITPQHSKHLKELVALADILTPNITEACLLTDTPYKADGWTESQLSEICRKLCKNNRNSKADSSPKIVITGLNTGDQIMNFVWEDNLSHACYSDAARNARHGTGDLFASIIAADALNHVPFLESVQKAADFVTVCLQGTDEADIPEAEGILFEKYLGLLQNKGDCR